MELENAFDREYNVLDYSKQQKEQQEHLQEKKDEEKPYINKMKSVKENTDREKRIVFLGNVSIDMSKKQIIKHFRQYGKIEKIWIRSIPVNNAIKLPKKVKILKDHVVNFCKKEKDAQKCIEQSNNILLQGRHIHVTKGNHVETDYKTTVFVGNLPYDIDEEELREFVQGKCGQIEYIRLIRDKLTYKGKGIGYIKFQNKEGQEKCLNLKDKFKDRELRIQKAKKKKLNKNKQDAQSEQQKNYQQRLSLKELKEREEEIKKLSQANLQDNQVIDEQRMEQIYRHKGVIPQNQIKKKIKKLKKKNLTQFQQAQMTEKIKNRANEKLKKDVFENENLLKKRRESIKKKKTMYKRLHKQQQKQTKHK